MPDVFDEFAARVTRAMADAGEEMAAETRALISTPPSGPARPGDPPHGRSGHLIDGVTSETHADGDRTTTALISAAPYSERLEREGHPFVSAVAEEWAVKLPDFLRHTLGI